MTTPGYVALTEAQITQVTNIKSLEMDFAAYLDSINVPDKRLLALAKTKLQEARWAAVEGVTVPPPPAQGPPPQPKQ